MTRRAARLLLLASALLAGCSLDYGAVQGAESIADSVPDTVAIDVIHKVHEKGRLALELEAGRTETWGAQKKMVLEEVRFVQYAEDSSPATSGEARHVVYHTDTEDAEVSGAVRVYSQSEKAGITAPALSWQSKPRLLTAPPGAVVRITKDDGSSITGSGFTGDFRTREVSFGGPVEGTYVWTGDEQDGE